MKTTILALGMATTLVAAAPALAQHATHTQSATQQTGDQAFVKQAIQGNLAEVQLGQLAQQKATDPQVRQFGQMLATDHEANNEKAEALAKAMNVTPPSAPNAEQKQMYQRLSGLSGPAFDREFVSHMIADHRKDIALFTKETKSSNAQVAQYAQATLPDLKKHLQAAEVLSKTTTKSSSAQGR